MSAQAQVHAIEEAGTAGQARTPRQVRHRLLILAAALAAVLALAAGAIAADSPATPSFASEGKDDGPYTQQQDHYLAGVSSYPGP